MINVVNRKRRITAFLKGASSISLLGSRSDLPPVSQAFKNIQGSFKNVGGHLTTETRVIVFKSNKGKLTIK